MVSFPNSSAPRDPTIVAIRVVGSDKSAVTDGAVPRVSAVVMAFVSTVLRARAAALVVFAYHGGAAAGQIRRLLLVMCIGVSCEIRNFKCLRGDETCLLDFRQVRRSTEQGTFIENIAHSPRSILPKCRELPFLHTKLSSYDR